MSVGRPWSTVSDWVPGCPHSGRGVTSGGTVEVRAAEDSAVVVDAGGVVLAWSDAAERLLGYGAAEVVGRPAGELLAGELPGPARRRVADGQRWAGEVA